MTKLACRSRAVLIFAILVSLLSLALSEDASAEGKKISGTAKFGPTLSQTTLLPGDVPQHQVALVTRLQSWNSADPDWNNVEVTNFVFSDFTAGTGYHRGYNANVHPGGHRTFLGFEGRSNRTTNPDGSWESKFEGKLWFTGGTGKFQGVTGEGSYIGKSGAASGTAPISGTYEWQLEYKLPR